MRKDLNVQYVYEPSVSTTDAKNTWFILWMLPQCQKLACTNEGEWYIRTTPSMQHLMFVYHNPIRRYAIWTHRPVPKKVWAAFCAEVLASK